MVGFPRSAGSYLSVLRSQFFVLLANLKQVIRPKFVLIALAVIVILAIFGRNLKDAILVSILALAASYSTIYKRTIRVPSAIELVTVGTVICGAAYGPLIGILFGVLTTFASEIISSGIDAFTLFYAIARAFAGAAAFYLGNPAGLLASPLSVVALGMVAVGIFNVLCQPIYQMSGDIEARLKGIYYLIVNTLFNLVIFTFLGNLLLTIARWQ